MKAFLKQVVTEWLQCGICLVVFGVLAVSSVHAAVVGSLAGDFVVPTEHSTNPAVLGSYLYENGEKTTTQTGEWSYHAMNETNGTYYTMDSSRWFTSAQGSKACYSDPLHCTYGNQILLFFSNYANTPDGNIAAIGTAVDDNYLFNHPGQSGNLYAGVVRWTPSSDYDCFNSDNQVTFSGELKTNGSLRLYLYGYDSEGKRTQIRNPVIDKNSPSDNINWTVDKYSYYDFVLSANGSINSDSNALKLSILRNDYFVKRYNSLNVEQVKGVTLAEGLAGAVTGDRIVLGGDVNAGAASTLADGISLTMESDVAGTLRTVTNASAGTFLNAATATLTLKDLVFDGAAFNATGNITFQGDDSSVTFKGNTGADISSNGIVTFKDAGEYRLEGGISAASLDIQNGTSVVFGPNATNTVTGNSTINGTSVTFEGTQSLTGALTLTNAVLKIGTDTTAGQLTLSNVPTMTDSKIQMDIFTIDDFDKMNFTGVADMTDNTAFEILFNDLFLPENASFEILTSGGAMSGLSDDLFTVLGTPNNYEYNFEFGAQSVTLNLKDLSVPEPATWVMIVLGVLLIPVIRGKR